METRLYWRLYRSAVILMITTLVISIVISGFIIVNLLLRPDRSRDPFFEHVRAEVTWLRDVLITLPSTEQQEHLQEWSMLKNWGISLWKNQHLQQAWGEAAPSLAELESGQQARSGQPWIAVPFGEQTLLVHIRPGFPGHHLSRPGHHKAHPHPFGHKILGIRIPPQIRDWLLIMLVTMGLMIALLIPFVRRIVQPFQELLASIRQVSAGNYETPLNLKPGSEFEVLATEFNHMTAQIQQALTDKQRLIADVSHELRSPLARLRVALELMMRKGTVPEKYAQRAVSELEQLDSMIDDLLDASRLELRAHFHPQILDLGDFLAQLLEKNRPLFQRHPLKVSLKQPEAFPCLIDAELFERACNNIFNNTLKHVPPEGSLSIEIKHLADGIQLCFQDSGSGVPSEDLERIFEPFVRSDASRTRKTGGVGLGLSIVKQIIGLHQGRVWAELPVEGGFAVCFHVPKLDSKWEESIHV